MRPGARLKAAVEVLEDIFDRHRPAATALADWGKAHRFAGSGDRAAIGTLIFDVLRRRQSLAAQMQSAAPRALVIAAAPRALGLTPDEVAAAADGSDYALSPLTAGERAGLEAPLPADAPLHVKGDFPAWLEPSLVRTFGTRAAEEGSGLATRAPVDVRTNTLKATREKVLKALASLGAEPCALSPVGVRIAAPAGGARSPHVEAEASHGKGWFEIQDEGSQVAALLAGARPRMQVLDLCAGAGGKTLALAAAMGNSGQVYAYDSDRAQLRPIFERLKRAGARSVQVMDGGDEAALLALGPRFDVVLVDAPCSGSGTWRRHPDSKWRLRPEALAFRQAGQREVLSLAARLVKPRGRLVYVTCSVLPEENDDQVDWFLESHEGFRLEPLAETARDALSRELPPSAGLGPMAGATLLLTPATHGTDGFFIAAFRAAS